MDTTQKNTTKTVRIIKALNALGVYPYRAESSYAKYDAPRNLQDRTHYTDPDTLKYFGARILSAGARIDGLLYSLVESVNGRPDHGRINKRAVLFDCFGTVVFRSDFYGTRGKAARGLSAFLESFDVLQHYTETIKNEIDRRRREARWASNALRGRVSK